MRYKLMLLMLTISVILSGCINTGTKDNVTTKLVPEKMLKVNYVDKHTILNGEDFPDFKLMDNVYYIAPENLPLTIETEMGHGVYEMNNSANILPGYMIYGSSELYNSSKDSMERYLLVQYQVFDSNDSLGDTINTTAEDIYIKNGYKRIHVDNTNNRNMVVFESNVTNHTNMNITVILFGFDTVIGKVGVQDSKDRSLNESLKILDVVFDRLKVKTKEVEVAKLDSIKTMQNATMGTNASNGQNGPNDSNGQN